MSLVLPKNTSICGVVSDTVPAWAEPSTRTASLAPVSVTRMVVSSVSVALVPPSVAVAEAMWTPETRCSTS